MMTLIKTVTDDIDKEANTQSLLRDNRSLLSGRLSSRSKKKSFKNLVGKQNLQISKPLMSGCNVNGGML